MPNDFLEKTLEEIIYENRFVIHNYGLCKFKSTNTRQFYLPSGKIVDVLSFDITYGHLSLDVYELKRFTINEDAIIQAYNYFVELSSLVNGYFKSYDIHIVMVGKKYIRVPILEKMNVPFSVYVYDYTLTGMTFDCVKPREEIHYPSKQFSSHLCKLSGFPENYPILTVIEKPTIVVKTIEKETIIYKKPPSVKTVMFPEQPAWSQDFLKEVPFTDLMEDFDIDESDYEPDTSDFEPDSDIENEYLEEDESTEAYLPTLTVEEQRQYHLEMTDKLIQLAIDS